MAQPRVQQPLSERLRALGARLGDREAAQVAALEAARKRAETLHAQMRAGLDAFHEAAAGAGAPHLRVELSPPRLDDKHVRAIQLELARGRHRGIVTVKARGEVTLVGPFRSGKTEGPCKSFPFDAEAELAAGLAAFLERFLEEAASP
jgi:hypothetical protein